MIDKDMEQIRKEWLMEFLVLVDDVEIFDVDIIRSPLVNGFEDAGKTSAKKKNKKEEV
jgi:hypothetical protein